MADRGKVIEELQKAKEILGKVEEPTFWLDFVQVALRNAIELLKEQEVVKPEVLVDTWVCGNCMTSLERQSLIEPNVLINENFKYCPCCGREVKWDEID